MTNPPGGATDRPPKPSGELANALAELGLPATAWETVHLPAGEVLFEAGAPADAYYLLSAGRLEVYLSDAGSGKVVLEELLPGDAFGELALLDTGARTASVAARADATLLALRREAFHAALRDSPDLTIALLAVVGERWRRNLRYLDYLLVWARLVSEGEYETARAAITRQAAAFGGDTAHFVDTFAAMVEAVKAREEALLGELALLRIRIDHEQSASKVSEITDSDFFRELQRKARRLRQGDATVDDEAAATDDGP